MTRRRESAVAPRRRARWAAAMFAMLAFAGCETVGNGRLLQLDIPSAQALLVPGVTTRDDVARALGQGEAIQFESGWQTWHYLHREGLAAGWDAVPYVNLFTTRMKRPTRELVILFDPQGVVRRWSLDEQRPSDGEGSRNRAPGPGRTSP